MGCYTKNEIEDGIGCYTQGRTKIAEILEGENAGKFITCEINDRLSPFVELSGFAYFDEDGEIVIDWI